jgi:hypothetical protein
VSGALQPRKNAPATGKSPEPADRNVCPTPLTAPKNIAEVPVTRWVECRPCLKSLMQRSAARPAERPNSAGCPRPGLEAEYEDLPPRRATIERLARPARSIRRHSPPHPASAIPAQAPPNRRNGPLSPPDTLRIPFGYPSDALRMPFGCPAESRARTWLSPPWHRPGNRLLATVIVRQRLEPLPNRQAPPKGRTSPRAPIRGGEPWCRPRPSDGCRPLKDRVLTSIHTVV